MKPFEFFSPTRIVFGRGQLSLLGQLVDPARSRVLVVTDRGVAEHTGAVETVTRGLGNREVSVFAEVEPNPSFATVERGGLAAREHGAELVIGLGGGSPMDAAKGVAILATNPGGCERVISSGEPAVAPLPVVCIPTTAGTGSEVTPFAVFTDAAGQTKRGYASASIFPVLSVVDPELTYSMPAAVVADTGLDALTHAVEAHLSLDATPLSDLYALAAAEQVRDHLPAATGGQRDAMGCMAFAAMLAGVAITHAGTTLLHVMGYPLTVFHGVSHGRASAAMLPDYLDFLSTQAAASAKVARVSAMFAGVGGVRGFIEARGVSTRIADYGVEANEIPVFVDRVIVKDDLRITPAEVGRAEIAAIYGAGLGQAWHNGELREAPGR